MWMTRVKAAIENVATAAVALCAVAVTLMMVRREFFTPDVAAGPRPPHFVKHWEAYATSDEQIGPSDAPDTVLVFSDFECPFCRRLSNELETLQRSRSILVIHRNYPISTIHPFAHRAAVAAECANIQGAFSNYHDSLFARQSSLDSVDFGALAATVGIADTTIFARCLSDSGPIETLKRDSLAAEELDISGTPLVVVNGWEFEGTPAATVLASKMRGPVPD
jgi:protein-disulfide isomerase